VGILEYTFYFLVVFMPLFRLEEKHRVGGYRRVAPEP
jgi:hypothetical protein